LYDKKFYRQTFCLFIGGQAKVKKGQVYEGIIEKVEFPNKGIVSVEGEEKKVLVKNGIPGQKVRFCVNKLRKGKAEGRLLEVLEKSQLETRGPVCSIFPDCGGCMYQTMAYDEQIEMKEQQVKEILDTAIVGEYEFEGVKKSPKEFSYRNKMEFSFGDEYKDGPLSLGLHKKGSTYDVLTAHDCKLVHSDMTKILCCVLAYFKERNVSYYKKMQHVGYLRHLLLRRGEHTGEILVNLVTTTQEDYDLQPLVDALLALELEGTIVGILHILNDSLSDVVQSDETRVLYGKDYFYEKLLGIEFKVTPFSFFQPNSKAAEVLYSTVREYLGNMKGKVLYDLFSGTGTIGQILSPVSEKVIGVEIIEEAVDAANENAKRNGITNCKFLAGDVFKVLDEIEEKPDVIVLDPPRDGIHPKALPKILDYGVDTIVYISCKVTSLARDSEMIQAKGYRVVKAVAVDQFCHTVHVETVALLQRV
jgi:23S rRNA (uracil-5-)-methyltransferase RumA